MNHKNPNYFGDAAVWYRYVFTPKNEPLRHKNDYNNSLITL